MMRRTMAVLAGLLLAAGAMLSACGGNDSTPPEDAPAASTPEEPARTVFPTPTPRPPAPRNRPLPEGDPYAFQAPFSVGEFLRQTVRGHATSTATGGQRATYENGAHSVSLTVYHHASSEEAVRTVRFALQASSVAAWLDTPYFGPTVAYGLAQDQHGGLLAAWSHFEWSFLVHTTGPRDVLDTFLEAFPY